MVRDVAICGPETDLAEAARTMRENDCGALPVVANRKVVGIITDRDLSMFLAADSRPAREIRVREMVKGPVQMVQVDDDCTRALELMAVNQIRRLPVIDMEERLQGIISLNDFIIQVDKVRGVTEDDLSYLDVMGALKAVSRHRVPPEEIRSKTRRRTRESRLVRR
jgi:predicted transcriptional regulator